MKDIVVSDAQNVALKKIIEWYKGGRSTPQVFYLAGYAGTGKSTLAKIVSDTLAAEATFNVIPAAFTGKAANVLRQKGNPNAMTFHSGMYIPVRKSDESEIDFRLDPDAPFSDADLILADEVSMINEVMAKDAESFGKKILVMGDPGQLPPVQGCGYWIHHEPDVFLHEIHRQALDSAIIRLANLARKGKQLPHGSWSDNDGNKVQVLEYEHGHAHLMCDESTQAICGTHKHRKIFTAAIRDLRGFGGHLPLKDETVICVKNDRDRGIYNGCFGRLLEDAKPLNNSKNYIYLDVKMEDLKQPLSRLRTNRYHFDDHFEQKPSMRHEKGIQEFDWGYILTCHKAQGSEWDHVTVLDDSAVFREDRDKWRYTAITRASKGLTFLDRTF